MFILVAKTPGGGLVVSGLHRPKKAVKLNLETIPYKRLTKELFDKGEIKKKVSTEGFFKGW